MSEPIATATASSSGTATLVELRASFRRADYQTVVRDARAAIARAQAEGDESVLAQATLWLGAGLTMQGLYQAALTTLRQALDRITALNGAVHTGRVWNYLGVVHEELGDIATALAHYEHGLTETRAAGDTEVEVYLLVNLSDCLVAQGQYALARPRLEDAIRAAAAVGDWGHHGWVLSARARMHAACGDLAAAHADHLAAIDSTARGESPRMHAEVLKDYGAFLGGLGDHDAALAQVQRALALVERLGIRREIYRAHEVLADIHERRGDLRAALRHLRAFQEVRASVFDEVLRERVESMAAQAELERAQHAHEIERLRSRELAEALAELERRTRELDRLSRHDPLTDACNRRHLNEALAREFARAGEGVLVLALIDVDHFKRVNDRHLHAVGDAVLCRLVARWRQRLGEGDVLARFGGEEFALLWRAPDLAAARAHAEALREDARVEPWPALAPDLAITVSIGLAQATEAATWEELLRLADRRLYQAKDRGRDRVCGPGD